MEILIIKDTSVLARCYSREELKKEAIRLTGASLHLDRDLAQDNSYPDPNGFMYELYIGDEPTGKKYFSRSVDHSDKELLWDIILRSDWFLKKCGIQFYTNYVF